MMSFSYSSASASEALCEQFLALGVYVASYPGAN